MLTFIKKYKFVLAFAALILFAEGGAGLAQSATNWVRFPQSDTTVFGSMSLGIGALRSETNDSTAAAYSNMAIGYESMGIANLTTGATQNIAIGNFTLDALTTGTGNLVLGYNSGTTLTTGSNNIIIGNALNTTTSTTSNQINIGGVIGADVGTKHAVFGGALPAVTSGSGDCGTSPSIAGSDNVMLVTLGSSTNGGKCTATFANAWTTPPVCVCNNDTTSAHGCQALASSTTSVALTASTTYAAADKLEAHCFGYQP